MKKSLIPWHVFLAAIAGEEPGTIESWLDRWGFTDDGVVLIGMETHYRGPGLPLDGYERQSHFSQSLILRVLLDTGCVLREDTVELWSYNKEL
jgi:hypothetical protein